MHLQLVNTDWFMENPLEDAGAAREQRQHKGAPPLLPLRKVLALAREAGIWAVNVHGRSLWCLEGCPAHPSIIIIIIIIIIRGRPPCRACVGSLAGLAFLLSRHAADG